MAESNATKPQQASSSKKKKTTKKQTGAKKVTGKANRVSGTNAKADTGSSITEVSKMDSTQASATPVMSADAGPGGALADDHTVQQIVHQKPAESSSSEAGTNVIAWIALILSGLALCAGGYAWYLSAVDSRLNMGQQESRFNIVEQRVDGFDTAQSDSNSQISQLKSQLTQAEENFSNQVRLIRNEIVQQESAVREQIASSEKIISAQSDNFRQEFEALSDSIVKLRSELGRSIDSWTLEEVEQLIFVANQRLQFTGDSNLARQALLLADDRLKQLADPALNEVRQLLASEIAELNSVEIIDTTGVVNQLSALSRSVENLSLAGDIKIPDNEGSGSTSSASQPDSQADSKSDSVQPVDDTTESSGFESYTQPIVDAGADFFSNLGDLIQVEKYGKSIKPIISAEARQLTYEKTKLILESAQIAFIRQQPELFSNRIDSAREWVEENFDMGSVETTNWLAQLEQAGSISPQPQVPDISGSLNAIRNQINSRN